MAQEATGETDGSQPRLTRRGLLTLAVAAAAPTATVVEAAEGIRGNCSGEQHSARPSVASSRDQALHLVRRATYGPPPG